MKHQHVNNLFCYLIFTLMIICAPLSTSAVIMRTDVVLYDLATASQRSYSLSMQPTSSGTHVTLHRDDNMFSLLMDVTTCFNSQPNAGMEGYLWLKNKETQHTDPALLPVLNFSANNRLRVATRPLAKGQTLLLNRDSLSVLVVDPTMMTLGSAGCSR